MSGEPYRAFLDTNILMYALLITDPKKPRAEQVLFGGGVVSTQVLNELIASAQRKHKRSWPDIDGALRVIRALCGPAASVTSADQDAAVAIAKRYAFHIYDATIIASALAAKCDTLYTEDMQDGQQIEGLVVRNPFTPREPH